MIGPVVKPVGRFLALFTALTLVLPNPGFPLRDSIEDHTPSEVEATLKQTGLEEGGMVDGQQSVNGRQGQIPLPSKVSRVILKEIKLESPTLTLTFENVQDGVLASGWVHEVRIGDIYRFYKIEPTPADWFQVQGGKVTLINKEPSPDNFRPDHLMVILVNNFEARESLLGRLLSSVSFDSGEIMRLLADKKFAQQTGLVAIEIHEVNGVLMGAVRQGGLEETAVEERPVVREVLPPARSLRGGAGMSVELVEPAVSTTAKEPLVTLEELDTSLSQALIGTLQEKGRIQVNGITYAAVQDGQEVQETLPFEVAAKEVFQPKVDGEILWLQPAEVPVGVTRLIDLAGLPEGAVPEGVERIRIEEISDRAELRERLLSLKLNRGDVLFVDTRLSREEISALLPADAQLLTVQIPVGTGPTLKRPQVERLILEAEERYGRYLPVQEFFTYIGKGACRLRRGGVSRFTLLPIFHPF